MKKKVFCFLMALIFCFTPVLFAGCEDLEDLEDDFESGFGGGSGGGSGSGESFFADYFDGFKVVYSESQIGQDKVIKDIDKSFYENLLLYNLETQYGSGIGKTIFFPDAIRQTIINDGGTAKLVEGAPIWNWTLNPNDSGVPIVDIINDFFNPNNTYDHEQFINEFLSNYYSSQYPSLSDLKYYSIPIQIVLYETMLGYEQTTFEAGVETTKTGNSSNYNQEICYNQKDVFTIKVKTSPKSDLVGQIVYQSTWQEYFITSEGERVPVGTAQGEEIHGNADVTAYLEELKNKYYSEATYSGLTKADADELITYILNEVIGKDVVEYDYNELRDDLVLNQETGEYEQVNYRNYVYTVAEMIYKAVYDGSKEFIYTYKTDKMEVEYDFLAEQKLKDENKDVAEGDMKANLRSAATFKPTSASYLRDYDTDMFFASGNAFEGMDGATSFENSPMSEYQSVAIMSAKDDLELGGIWMQIFSPNPDLAITVYVRFWAYDKETGEGQLFEWEQDEINFYQTSPYDSAYAEEDCEYHDYVEGKGYLYKTTEDGITGYYTDFEVGVDLTGVPEKFQAPYDRDDPTELQIDAIKLPKFENTTENKLKAQSEGGAVNGITEAQLNGDYAYKVVPSKNGFGGVTVLDENQINFSFYEMVFDIQKDPTLENTNYDYKLAVVTPF